MDSREILFSWIGDEDLRSVQDDDANEGPILAAILARPAIEEAVLLHTGRSLNEVQRYLRWLLARIQHHSPGRRVIVREHSAYLKRGPWSFSDVERVLQKEVLERYWERTVTEGLQHVYQLSAGTAVMAAAWVLLAKERTSATLIASSKTGGVQEIDSYIEIFTQEAGNHASRLFRASAVDEAAKAAQLGLIHWTTPAMIELVRKIELLAPHQLSVLVLGETGVGKEYVARAIHEQSGRGPFEVINCAAIPTNLAESVLFGHRKGAFTGADRDEPGLFVLADGGTLFLDEVADLDLQTQTKLLRALQEQKIRPLGGHKERTINVRIIAATNKDPWQAIREGRFREDLYYRLAEGILYVPSWRERNIDDRRHFIEAFWSQEVPKVLLGKKELPKLSKTAIATLLQHPFPGNLRQLGALLKRLAIFTQGQVVYAEDVKRELDELLPLQATGEGTGQNINRRFYEDLARDILSSGSPPHQLRAVHAEIRKTIAQLAIQLTGSKAKAAQLLNISRPTLDNWLRGHGVEERGGSRPT